MRKRSTGGRCVFVESKGKDSRIVEAGIKTRPRSARFRSVRSRSRPSPPRPFAGSGAAARRVGNYADIRGTSFKTPPGGPVAPFLSDRSVFRSYGALDRR